MKRGGSSGVSRMGPAFVLLAACGAAREPTRANAGRLETVPLVITEVAQSSAYDGTTSDKVEVFCTHSGGCAAFKVCDATTAGGTSSSTRS
jgi:hypothetical protein